MDFTLSPEDADALRELAALPPEAARGWLQDRPELARRMTEWPPEIRLEICRILYRSFPEATRTAHQARRGRSSDLVPLLDE